MTSDTFLETRRVRLQHNVKARGGSRVKKTSLALYQSPTCHGVTTMYGIEKSSFMTKIWCVKVQGIAHSHTKYRGIK